MGENETLSASFLSHLGLTDGRRDELEALLTEKLESARATWPTITLSPHDFIADLAKRMRDDEDVVAGLHQLREADLYLACASARQVAGAMEAFESTLFSRVATFIGRIDSSPAFVDEVKQALRIKLFVGSADNCSGGKIGQYSGRGSLESWVCAAAIRTAYDFRRAEVRREAADVDFDRLAASKDVELEVLRVRCQGDFREAVQDGARRLDARQRTLLRLYFLERLTSAQIGRLYRVHETTALRWIAQARSSLVERVRHTLRDKLHLANSELDGLVDLMHSRLDVSFRRIFETKSRTCH